MSGSSNKADAADGLLERRLRETAAAARAQSPPYLRQRILAAIEGAPEPVSESIGQRWLWRVLGMAACCAALVGASVVLRPRPPVMVQTEPETAWAPNTPLPGAFSIHPAAALQVSVEAPMLREGELLAGDVRRAADAVLAALPFQRAD